MKIQSLKVRNFRGIKNLILDALPDLVIIAGANGSSKSTIFDAIRLIKSIYTIGPQNEIAQWANEFQLPLTQYGFDISLLMNSEEENFEIESDFLFNSKEKAYLSNNARHIITSSTWAPYTQSLRAADGSPLDKNSHPRRAEVEALIELNLSSFQADLARDSIIARIAKEVGKDVEISPSPVLSFVFSTYLPGEVGIIDFNGPQRHFQREPLQAINLNIQQTDINSNIYPQTALYNYASKYVNIKAEMASSYVRELIAKDSGKPITGQAPLSDTLKELFTTFFVDKKFLGPSPQPNGMLEFPVELADGKIHDLNDLSAGEKEVLYGYLRLRRSAPQNSIILIDEPELHLNPKLTSQLPAFYNKYLGIALENQIWLVTHSDALLRRVVGRPGFAIYHMQPSATLGFDVNQARRLEVGEGAEGLLIDLVGDLASFRPGGKVILFEGGGESEFDATMTQQLFPELSERVNFISAGGKVAVRHLHEILHKAASEGNIPFKIYSITDRDSDPHDTQRVNSYKWDRYHIENYLIDEHAIHSVLRAMHFTGLPNVSDVLNALIDAARATIPNAVRAIITSDANRQMVSALDLRFNPKAPDLASGLSEAIERSAKALDRKIVEKLTKEEVKRSFDDLHRSFENGLTLGSWKSDLPGRAILKRFREDAGIPVPYVPFRNFIISKIAETGIMPEGMMILPRFSGHPC